MAQLFIRAVLHPGGFQNATILSPIKPGIGLTNIATGLTNAMTAGGIILGGGQAEIDGVALNACLLSPATNTNTPTIDSIDPPIIYTFCNATSPYGRDYLNLNLKMVRANDFSFNIQCVLNGQPLNITGGTLRMTAKWRLTDPDNAEVFSVFSPNNGIAFINATQGTATVTIASALTNIPAVPFHRVDLPYDIELTDVSGKIFTVMYGTLTILPNASRTSP